VLHTRTVYQHDDSWSPGGKDSVDQVQLNTRKGNGSAVGAFTWRETTTLGVRFHMTMIIMICYDRLGTNIHQKEAWRCFLLLLTCGCGAVITDCLCAVTDTHNRHVRSFRSVDLRKTHISF
jgi:hypothetical protein